MRANPVQILIVEDSEEAAVLLLTELEQKGYAPAHQRVETREEFLKALKNHPWDAVISDCVLPQFSGPEALQLFRQHGPDIPFIMVSGVFGEDMAVAMMKAGADDYIVKGNLARLVPALERELEAARNRRLQKRAEGAMQYLAAIVESSGDAIYGKTLDSIIESWNPAAERLFGYAADEIVGQSTLALFPENRRDELLDILGSIRRDETVTILETERRHKSGRIIPVSVTISPIKNVAGEIIGASCIARDITRQKQAEYEYQVSTAAREKLVTQLQETMSHLKILKGLLPICAFCHKIRNSDGQWERFEAYITSHTEADFTHGFCPECNEKHYGVHPAIRAAKSP